MIVADDRRLGTQEAAVTAVYLYDERGKITDSIYSGDGLTVEVEYSTIRPLQDLAVILGVYTDTNVKCFETVLQSLASEFGTLSSRERLRCSFKTLPLLAGRYFINLGLYPPDWDYVYDYHWQMHSLNVLAEGEVPSGISGVVSISTHWSVLSQYNSLTGNMKQDSDGQKHHV
jgi:lipopolysaccharide transport system ATP-binding protein